MTLGFPLPSLFIASSSEGLPVAYDIQEALENDCHATVWKQGVFAPSRTVMEGLLARMASTQFALFVFTPDDTLQMRGVTHLVTRDNVVFEMGLFIGALGLPRCMHIVPRGVDDLHLPSDLLGLTSLDYPTDRPDRDRMAALGPACNKIRRRLREHARPASAAGLASAAVAPRDAVDDNPTRQLARLQHYQALWASPPLADDRAVLRVGVPLDPHDPDLPREAIWRVFNFLESMAEAVLSGALDDGRAREAFAPTLLLFWPHAVTLLAPPNLADEFWQTPPCVAQLYQRWQA